MSSHCGTKLPASVIGPRIGEHALHLPIEHRRILQLAVDRQLQQLVVRDRVPEEERQLRRQLEVADRVGLARTQPRGNVLAAIEEERARQQAR